MALVDDDDNVLVGDWSAVEARPITVSITADNPFPVTGDTTVDGGPDTVTLTAVTDAPTGTTFTYQWQKKTGATWSDISMATNSTYKMADETSSTTKTIRVKATSGNTTYTSGEVYVTWDHADTFRNIINALVTGLSSTSTPRAQDSSLISFQSAQQLLSDCVALPIQGKSPTATRATFQQLVTDPAPHIQASLTVTCSSQMNDLWSSMATSFASTLSTLTTLPATPTDDDRAIHAILSTEIGQDFVASMSNATELKALADDYIPLARAVLDIPASSISSATSSGKSNATGLGCIPRPSADTEEDYTSHSTLVDKKYEVLNCLLDVTDYTFWWNLASTSNVALRANYTTAIGHVDYLSTSDFRCSIPFTEYFDTGVSLLARFWLERFSGYAVDASEVYITFDSRGETAACLKHDLAWGSLALFDNPTSATVRRDLDSAWNPRNKYLADATYLLDNICGVANTRTTCLNDHARFWYYLGSHRYYALLYLKGEREALARAGAVAEGNNNGWPVTVSTRSEVMADSVYERCSNFRPDIWPVGEVKEVKADGSTYLQLDFTLTGTCTDRNFVEVSLYYSYASDSTEAEWTKSLAEKQSNGIWIVDLWDGRKFTDSRQMWLHRIDYKPAKKLYGHRQYEIFLSARTLELPFLA